MSEVQGVFGGFERFQSHRRMGLSPSGVRLGKGVIEFSGGVLAALGISGSAGMSKVFLDWDPKGRRLRISNALGVTEKSVKVSTKHTVNARKFYCWAGIGAKDLGRHEVEVCKDGSVIVQLKERWDAE